MKQYLVFLLSLLTHPLYSSATTVHTGRAVKASPMTDSIHISLLTYASGEEIYSLFGYTAVQYENYACGIDIVFNYGIFNFNAPNFILCFVLGGTDYRLGAGDYERFAAECYYLERDVWQQELDFTPAEGKKLVTLFEESYRPENQVYRYNFFYDNCATRPHDLIEESIDNILQYADNMTSTNTGTSLHNLLHKYSKDYPWSRFGMDLCIGSQTGRPISHKLTMFAPFYVQDYFSITWIIDSNRQVRPLVLNGEKIIATGMEETGQLPEGFTPSQVALSLFILTAAATLYGIRRRGTLWGIDLVLFFAARTVGCILTFLVLLSQHSAASPNYLLFVFHPFHLVSYTHFRAHETLT